MYNMNDDGTEVQITAFSFSKVTPQKPCDIHDWNEVVRVNDWNPYDAICGKPVPEGRYLIQWPDGSQTTEAVIESRRGFQYSDMGHTYDGIDTTVHVKAVVRGVNAIVPLVGLRIKKL